jgi:hypothetical protein
MKENLWRACIQITRLSPVSEKLPLLYGEFASRFYKDSDDGV